MAIERFHRQQIAAAPWKNGGGLTREIARKPRGAVMGDFDWRVSIAEIGAEGEFSIFEGVDRVILLLDGDGVRLRSRDGEIDHRLDTLLAPFVFSGEVAITASLLGGPSSDFNVMTRRGVIRADVRVATADERLVPSEAGVLFAARGQWTAAPVTQDTAAMSTTMQVLDPGAGVWWDDGSLAWQLTAHEANSALIVVHFHA